MQIVRIEVDERETSLYTHILNKSTQSPSEIQITKKVLPLGDVLIYLETDDLSSKPLVVLERKTFQDLFASIKDGRYKEQSYRLVNTNLVSNVHNIIYLIEGAVSQLSSVKDQSLLYSTVTSLNLYKGFSIYRTTHIQESAEYIYEMAMKILRNAIQRKEYPLYMPIPESNTQVENIDTQPITQTPYSSVVKINKKENITPENIGIILLCQIPGIQHVTAEQIMKKYNNIGNLIQSLNQDPKCMDQFYMMTSTGSQRKLSQSIVESLKRYLLCN